MIHILYFASVREQLGCAKEDIEPGDHIRTVENLIAHLASRNQQWKDVFSQDQLLYSVNQVMAKKDQLINNGDEVAFFPHVTGG